MNRRHAIRATIVAGCLVASAIVTGLAVDPALAQGEPVKVGLIVPMTGPFASVGKQLDAGARLYLAQHGDTVAGRKIELILKDDGGVADTTRRIAQELVVNDKVTVLAGFGLTPLALATAPIATQSKTPAVVMVAATSSVINASPFFVRSSFTLPQVTSGIAEWAPKNGIRKVVTLVSDYGPGIDSEGSFKARFEEQGGQVLQSIRVPVKNPDFAPFLQRVRDEKPDALFVFLPAGVGTQLMKQFTERGLDKAGIKLIATGDVTDDDILNEMGDVALGAVTSHHYSAAHPSETNGKFVKAFLAANKEMRPNFIAVSAYDGMHLIREGLKKTGGKGGEALVSAIRGMSFESPRGPVTIDAQTRDIVQDVYIRKVEKGQDGKLWNVEFDTIKSVKDPGKAR
jgi:branched-chain amino acid transport system substrate-binding protein